MTDHRWSGWPGAWCLDCGIEDPYEVALAEGKEFPEEEQLKPCPCPGSNNFNPYTKRQSDDGNNNQHPRGTD